MIGSGYVRKSASSIQGFIPTSKGHVVSTLACLRWIYNKSTIATAINDNMNTRIDNLAICKYALRTLSSTQKSKRDGMFIYTWLGSIKSTVILTTLLGWEILYSSPRKLAGDSQYSIKKFDNNKMKR